MALSGVTGHQPESYAVSPAGGQGQQSGSTAAVAQLFARMSQEIEEHKPKNCIHFIVDFLCKHYPEHLHGFASIWQMDPDLESERHEVVNFFKAHKISTAVAAHFTNAGYDTLDTLTTLSPDSLVDVEAFNNVKWLPGHKVRLQQIFGEISARVRAYKQQFPSSGAPHKKQHHRRAGSPAAAHHGGHGAGHHGGQGGAHGSSPAQGHHGHQISSYAHHAPSAATAAQAHHLSTAASLAHPTSLAAAHTALAAQSSLAAHASIPPYMGNNASSVLPSAGLGLGHGLQPQPSLTPPSLPQPGSIYMPSPYQVS